MKNNNFFQIFEKALVSHYIDSNRLYDSIFSNADSIFGDIEYNEVFPISLKTSEKALGTTIDAIKLDSDYADVDVWYNTTLTSDDFYIDPLYKEEFLDLNPGVKLDNVYHRLTDICDFTYDQLFDIYQKYCNENGLEALETANFVKKLKAIATKN